MRTSRFLPLFIIAAAIFTITAACSSDKKSDDKPAVVKDERIPGDSTFYGLACEGCTDSVVVVLPTDDSDPITFSIIDAMQSRQVFGRPKIGDQLAIVINKEDKRKADIVIDLDELKGTWVYQVMPKLRKMPHIAGMPQPKAGPERDSMIQKLMVPIEQGFKIKKQFTMDPVGLRFKQTSLTGESPVEYPQAEYYKEWHVLNGKLVFTEGTNRHRQQEASQTETSERHRGDCTHDERQSAAEIQRRHKGILPQEVTADCRKHTDRSTIKPVSSAATCRRSGHKQCMPPRSDIQTHG